MTIDWRALRLAAEAARAHAHAPYSKFQVGAALQTDRGQIFAGCNVENASFGLTICAERNAVFAAVATGARDFSALVIVSSGDKPVTPCGACRQVLIEFGGSFPVRCYGNDGSEVEHTTSELLPHGFSGSDFSTRVGS